jgi:tellurite resistance-related uncharacterized protein
VLRVACAREQIQILAVPQTYDTGVPVPGAAEMPVLPADVKEYKRTASFTEANLPAGLVRDHGTKPGVWALIVIEAGTLEYTIEDPVRTFLLTPELPGVIPPVVPHRVKVLGPVRFHLEFLASPPPRLP